EKRVFLVILFTSFSGSLVSRIPGAVQSAGWVITITTSIAPVTGVTLSWENTCEPFGDLLPDFLNGRGVC
uniref:hypothetical protein n=1 Tax=Escherichia coli TaxID=562 RepID=UPI001BC8A527